MAAKTTKKKVQYWGTGRRKKAIARVRLIPNGTGAIVINKKTIDEYFGLDTLKLIVRQPLVLTESESKYDVMVNVCGGGYTGQAGAIRHGIARALVLAEPELRPTVKKAGYLTRDSRMKERKKYGLKRRSSRSVNQAEKAGFHTCFFIQRVCFCGRAPRGPAGAPPRLPSHWRAGWAAPRVRFPPFAGNRRERRLLPFSLRRG